MADRSASSQEVLILLQTYLATISKFSKLFIPFAEEVKDELFLRERGSDQDEERSESEPDVMDDDILPTDPRYETVKDVAMPLQSAIDAVRQLGNIQSMLQDPNRIHGSGGTGRLTHWHGKLVESFSDAVVQHIQNLKAEQKEKLPQPAQGWKEDFKEHTLEPVKRDWRKFREALEELRTEASRSPAATGTSPTESISNSLRSTSHGGATIPSTHSSSGQNVNLYAGTMQRKRVASGSPGGTGPKRLRSERSSEAFEMSLYANLSKSSSHSEKKTPATGEPIDMKDHAESLAQALRFELQMEKHGDVWNISLLSLNTADPYGTTHTSDLPEVSICTGTDTSYLKPPSASQQGYQSDGGSSGSFNFEKELDTT